MNTGPLSGNTALQDPLELVAAERLSAWFDGELDDDAAQLAVADLMRDQQQRRRYAHWCCASDAMRSLEVLAQHSPRLCAQVVQALEAEPALPAPRALAGMDGFGLRPILRRYGVGAVTVAAAAAVLGLVAVPLLQAPVAVAPRTAALAGAVPAAAAGAQAAAVGASGARSAANPQLDPYLQAHRNFMGGGVMPAAAVYLRSSGEGER